MRSGVTKKLISPQCKSYNRCNAVLCPLEIEEIRSNPWRIWYPDEPICSNKDFQGLGWVRNQKLIAKKHGSVDRCFTVNMLEAITSVRQWIRGANADLGVNAEKRWFQEFRRSRK